MKINTPLARMVLRGGAGLILVISVGQAEHILRSIVTRWKKATKATVASQSQPHANINFPRDQKQGSEHLLLLARLRVLRVLGLTVIAWRAYVAAR